MDSPIFQIWRLCDWPSVPSAPAISLMFGMLPYYVKLSITTLLFYPTLTMSLIVHRLVGTQWWEFIVFFLRVKLVYIFFTSYFNKSIQFVLFPFKYLVITCENFTIIWPGKFIFLLFITFGEKFNVFFDSN